jgi:hypothetical protein
MSRANTDSGLLWIAVNVSMSRPFESESRALVIKFAWAKAKYTAALPKKGSM